QPLVRSKTYKYFDAGFFGISAGTVQVESMGCPGTKTAVGGGAQIGTSDLAVNMHSTFSVPGGWRNEVDDAGPNNSSADAWVVCSRKPAGLQFVDTANIPLPPNVQTRGTVTCPAGKVMLSGGTGTTNTPVGMDINSSFPSGNNEWIVDMNNNTGVSTTFDVTAWCATQPVNYSIQVSSS